MSTAPRRLRAVLFDLDGTLLDSIDGIVASFRHALGLHLPHRTFTRRELIMKIGEPVPVQMLQFSEGDKPVADQLAAAYRAHNMAALASMPLFPGVHAALDALKARGFVTGLVTSKSLPAAKLSLEQHDLYRRLDIVMTTEDTTRHKPDPMPLTAAAERLGLAPAQLAYVGDSVHDLHCANGAGAVAVAALWGPFDEADLLRLAPAYAVRSLDELLSVAAFSSPG